MFDWDDLRFLLAVARSGSALRAAQALNVNQTTVMRRMDHIEAATGAGLFERRRSGYRLTPLGERIAAAAARIEDEVKALESEIGAAQRALSGSVRVTASELMANFIVTRLLRDFRRLHPGILVELMTDERRLDLARGEADVALRAGLRPEGAGIVARRLPDAAWSVYCSRSYAEEHSMPRTVEELDGHAVVAADGDIARLSAPRLLARLTPSSRISTRSNSLTNLLLALKAGLGIAPLPCIAGDADQDLLRCLPPIPELDSELWLIVREDVKSAPHVRAFAEFLADQIHGMRAELAGKHVL
jgi:DNA-binding transcriptional LysR family regulator